MGGNTKTKLMYVYAGSSLTMEPGKHVNGCLVHLEYGKNAYSVIMPAHLNQLTFGEGIHGKPQVLGQSCWLCEHLTCHAVVCQSEHRFAFKSG